VDLRPAFPLARRRLPTTATSSDRTAISWRPRPPVDADFHLGWPPVSVNKKNTEAEIKKRFDPHPNDKGTTAQADEILKVLP
jgi:hypothetical protein